MSRWSSALPGRRGKPGTGRGRRGPAVDPNGSGPQAGGAPPVEEVDGVLLVRSVDDDSFPLATVADVAHALSADEGIVTVMVGSAGAGGTRDGDLWARLRALLDSLRAKGTRRIRLVMSGAGDDQPGRPCAARRIADAWQVEVIAPDGAVLITPGGALFVHGDSPPGRGWWCFAPDEAPRKLGPRAPEPAWQEALGRVPARTTGGCVVDHIPAGVVMRPAEAPGPGLDDLCFAVPVDLDRPTVLVGALQAEDVAADEVAAVLAALPVAQRSRARLAPGGRRDLLRLGQSVSDLLGSEVEVLTGLPLLDDYAPPGAAPRPTLVGTDGKPSWRPFVSSVACRPADAQGRVFAPRLVESRLPDWTPGGSEPGTVRLTDRWQATVTRAGLALWEQGGPRPPMAGQTVDPDVCAIELGAPGQPLDDSLLLALSRLLVGLESEVRAKVTLLVRGRLTAGEGELRRLAGEHGVAAIRYVTARQPRHPGPAVHRPGSTTVGVAPAGAGPVAPLPRRAPALAGPAVPQAEAEPGGKNAATGSAATPGERRPVPRPPAPALRLSSPAQEAGTSQAVRTTAGNPGGVTARRTGHTPVPRVGGDSGVHTPLGPRPQPEAGAAGTAPEAEPATSTNAGAVAEESPPASGGTGLGPPDPVVWGTERRPASQWQAVRSRVHRRRAGPPVPSAAHPGVPTRARANSPPVRSGAKSRRPRPQGAAGRPSGCRRGPLVREPVRPTKGVTVVTATSRKSPARNRGPRSARYRRRPRRRPYPCRSSRAMSAVSPNGRRSVTSPRPTGNAMPPPCPECSPGCPRCAAVNSRRRGPTSSPRTPISPPTKARCTIAS